MLAKGGKNAKQQANMASALNLWMRTFSFAPETFVGAEFSTDFDGHFLRFSDAHAERLASRTQKDRQEQIVQWARLFAAQSRTDSLPQSFHAALQVALEASGLSKAETCRRAGITPPTLNRWLTGPYLPQSCSMDAVRALAGALGFEADALLSRLPPLRRTRYSREEKRPPMALTAYGKRIQRGKAETPNYTLRPTKRIRVQWVDVLAFKTDAGRETADKTNTWRLKPLDRTGMRVQWPMLYEGQVCVTGAVAWNSISQFLGYLRLPKPSGQGIPDDAVDTIAWLAVPEFIRGFNSWKRRRAGNIRHRGLSTFLQMAISFVAPKSGWVWNNPSLASSLPTAYGGNDNEQQWQARCAQAHVKLKAQLKALTNEGKLTRSRDSQNRAASILNSAHPLKSLLRLVQALEANPPPPAHVRDYRAWIRDVLMVKLLVSNPLRVGHFSVMTYRPDGSGNLYRSDSGAWRMRFMASDFKNQKGAAAEDYDVAVEPSVHAWIHRYLSEARPYAVDADKNEYLLLPFVRGPRTDDEGVTWSRRDKSRARGETALEAHGLERAGNWSSDCLGKRIQVLTALYLPDTLGFGPHVFRHIIATDHLKRHPRDYLTVAHLLHDRLDTVLREYGHLTVDDGLRVLHSGVQDAMAELKASRS
ncbi:helix-turn-helix domain-containing protein [Variovorax saccharolyticus]|uniref:helix-turn-helix domain-containing protein n=1 Tax=Variovorax saccharolyticus TaxID=3053516 RepID=UPI002575C641|nr:helix-turn-helix domain-containing protein [Variovorax sp. J22R187]MDM0018015.1 helix-turn-helix domain-containing protein [Variovorax sp. J22R187]